MKKYVLFLSVILLAVFSFFLKKHFHSKSTYIRLLAQCGQFKIPFIDVELQGKTYPFKINLGWTRSPLYLSKDLLSGMDKMPNGVVKIDFEGKEVEYPSYLLPEIKIGDLIFKDLPVMEIDHENNFAYFGLKFFEERNLLLDFANSTMILCNDLNKIKQVGYSIEEMTKVPCQIGKKGILLSVSTDIGLVRLGISTENTFSLIRPNLVNEKITTDGPMGMKAVTTSIFTIGGRNFGAQDLCLYGLFPESYGVDGCMGMDFLLDHVLYFDFKNKVAYIQD
jgi:hypothetical protein